MVVEDTTVSFSCLLWKGDTGLRGKDSRVNDIQECRGPGKLWLLQADHRRKLCSSNILPDSVNATSAGLQ